VAEALHKGLRLQGTSYLDILKDLADEDAPALTAEGVLAAMRKKAKEMASNDSI
jgi:hypothetical protein